MTAAGFEADPDALRRLAQGIRDTISQLKELGVVEGSADAGRGFSTLGLRVRQVGHAGLQQAWTQFLDRWSWGVRSLVRDGNQIAHQLGLNAGAYDDAEQYAAGVLKDVIADAVGNPHLSDEQVQSESWSQVAGDNWTTDVQQPDYSAASWQHAGDHMAATWRAEGRDIAAEPLREGRQLADAAGTGAAERRAEDTVFGPAASPPEDGGR